MLRIATVVPRLLRLCALLASTSLLFGAADLRAQSADWSAILMTPAFPSPFVSEWQRNPQNLSLTLVHTGQGSREYQVEGVLREARRGEMARAESPPLFVDGAATFTLTAADLDGWRVRLAQSADVDAAVRSGVIPEGDYEICVRVLTPQRVQLAEDCARFSITLPDAPQLVFPGPGDPLLSAQPTFQWTPVLLPPAVGATYRLRIAPRHATQTPLAALQANQPHHDIELAGAPFFVYPMDALPLEAGVEYVWQVEALDGMGQSLLPGGLRSEIWTFRASSVVGPGPIAGLDAVPDTLELVPGVARLIGLRSAEAHETPFGYSLNGNARIEVSAPFTAEARVRLQDLELDKVGQSLRVRSGRVVATLAAEAVPEHLRGRFTLLDQLEYTPEQGMTLHGTLRLPGMASGVQLSGRAQVTAAGIYGVLEGTAPTGGALIELGADPLALRLRTVRVELPSGRVEFDGALDVFAGAGACSGVRGEMSAEGVWTARLVCTPGIALPLVAGASPAELRLNSVIGELSASFAEGTPRLDYDLTVNSRLRLDAGVGDGCSAQLGLSLTNGAVSLTNATPRCDPSMGEAALDWLALAFSNLRVERFGYAPGSGFDFALRVDIDPSVIGDSGVRLPTISDVGISRDGLSFPAFNESAVGDAVELAGYRARISRVAMSAFTLGWDAWQRGSAEGFGFELDLALSMPNLPAPAPACLTAGTLPVASARLAGGRLSVELGGGGFDPAHCRLALGDDLAFEIERLSGQVAVQLHPQLALASGAEAHGRLVLPPLFRCSAEAGRLPLSGGLRLGPRGELVGTVSGLAPECPADFGAVALSLRAATLELGGTPGERVARIAGSGNASFAALDNVAGSGEITIDLIAGRITDGELLFRGPFRFDLPRGEPLLSFTLTEARLDRTGLRVDGRNALLLDDEQITTTFRNVVFDPFALRLSAGEVLFDAPFAVDAGVAENGGVTWRAVQSTAPFTLRSGARIALPVDVRLDSSGLRAEGSAGARLVYDSRDLAELGATFADGFVLGLEPVAVTDGVVEMRQDGARLAWIDANGFHADLAYLGRGLVPERLGLPNVELAYLQLINPDGTYNVATEQTPDGVRIYTAQGGGAPLVLPGLAFGGGTVPELRVAFDLTLDPLGERVIAGEFSATVPQGATSPFDLSQHDVPFIVTHLSYGRSGSTGEHRLALAGQLRLLGQTVGQPGSVSLELTAGGRLAGSFTVPASEQYALVAGSDRLRYAVSRLSGDFDVGLGAGGVRHWTVDHSGTLRLALGVGTPYSAAATLRASHRGFEFTEIETAGGPAKHTFDVGPVRLGVENVTVPRLAYSTREGWDFDIDFDLTLAFPELAGLDLPAAREIRLRRDGLWIPALHAPEITATPFERDGFSVKPLAFRMDSLHLDVFGTGRPANDDWGFSFDVEIAMRDLPAAAPAALKGVRVTALDVGYRNGRFTGEVEPIVFAEPITLPLGSREMAMQLRRLAGALRDVNGAQEIELVSDSLLWVAPDFMRCQTGDGTLPMGGGYLRLTSRGAVSGTVTNLAPTCPLQLGALALRATDGELTFGYAPGERGTAELSFAATARLPGPVEGDTIAARGALRMDLIDLEVLDGRLDITERFRWNLPAQHPFLSFVVHSGHIDRDGLVLTGEGGLSLDGDSGAATIGVTFNDFALGLADFQIRGGSAVFANDFALDVTLGQAELKWAARPATSGRPQQDGFRLAVPGGARLDAGGLGLEGEASAQLAFAGEEFPALRAVFADGFRIATEPVAVREGRAGFWRGDTEIAYVDRTGFWPGDLFALAQLPERLPLPDMAVAYLELRDPQTGVARVRSELVDGALHLQGAGVRLVVPGLKGDGTAPEATVSLNITVNPATFAVVSGAIEATGTGGQSLFGLAERFALPLELNAVRYADDGDGYRLTGDAQVRLPRALAGMPAIEVRRFGITENGPTGEVRLGSYRSDYRGTEAPLAERGFAEVLDVRIAGVQADLGARTLQLAGAVTLAPFADADGNRTPVHFIAGNSADGTLAFNAEASSLAGGVLDFGAATFTPGTIDGTPGLALEASDDIFAVRLGGVLKVPSLSDDFAVTIRGFEVATTGVRLEQATLDEEQAFQLFGATFTLKQVDGSAEPILALAYDTGARTLAMTMSGEIALPIFEQTSTFHGLRVTTAGDISLAHANLLSRELVVIDDVLTLDSLTIAEKRLHAALGVNLPEPLKRDEMQRVRFSFGTDGTVDGGGTVALYTGGGDEPGRAVSDIATVRLSYLDLDLRNSGSKPNARLRAVGDIELAGESGNRIEIGHRTGGEVYPGLTIDFREGVQWGNVRMQDSIRTPIEVAYLTLREVAVVDDPLGLSFTFGGRLGFDIPGVQGGVDFTDFRLTPRVLEADFGSIDVTGGHLSIADFATLELTDFAYSGTPTTLQVAKIGMPSPQSPEISSEMESVAVSSYIDFGGRISIGCSAAGEKCIASGGAEQVQFYRTAGNAPRTSFLVRQAHLEVGDLLDMSADLRYREGAGSSFELLLAANATVMQEYGATVVGLFDNTGGATRAGLFAALKANIPIAPPLILAEVGGGFFLNPRPEHIALIRQYAGVGESSISPPTGQFTGLLYGNAIIGSEEVASGRVLLTASEAGAQLSGNLVLLPAAGYGSDPLARGSFDVAVGFQKKYVEGNVQLAVGYGPIVSGSGKLEFFVYGTDAWGVMGDARLKFVSLVEGQAGFFVGAPGFMVDGSLSAGFDFWIVAVRASMDAAMWYQIAPMDLGAYLRVGAEASLLGGAVRANAELRGAMLAGGGESPLIYAGALAQGCVALVGCADANIWAKFQGGKVNGGFGKDPTMDAIIARADAARDNMKSAKEAAEAAVNDAHADANAVRLSDEELAAMFLRVSQVPGTANLTTITEKERGYSNYSANWSAESAHYTQYRDLLNLATAPARPARREDQIALESEISAIGRAKPTVLTTLSGLQARTLELQQLSEADWPESPVQSVSFARPQTRTASDEHGNEIKIMDSGPGFVVDDVASKAIQSDLVARKQAADALMDQVRAQADALEQGLTQTQNTLAGAGASGFGLPGQSNEDRSIPTFLGHHSRAVALVEKDLVFQTNFLMVLQDWYNAEHAKLRSRTAQISDLIGRKSGTMTLRDAKDLAEQRSSALGRLAGDWKGGPLAQQINPNLTPPAANDTLGWRSQATVLGRQLWIELADVGIPAAITAANTEITSMRSDLSGRIQPLREQHVALTASVNQLHASLAESTGNLYDLYDRYDYWLSTADELDAGNVASERARVRTQMTALEKRLRVPVIHGVSVNTAPNGYMAEEHVLVEAAGTDYQSGITPNAFGGISHLASHGSAMGARSATELSLLTYALAPSRTGLTQQRLAKVAVRADGPYSASANLFYTSRFDPVSYGKPSGGVTTELTDRTPPTTPRVEVKTGNVWVNASGEAAWMTDASRLETRWSAADPESGIAEYQYAIRGVTDTSRDIDWTSVGGRTNLALHGRDLPRGRYHVYVRARNGMGGWSADGRSAELRYDNTPPEVASIGFKVVDAVSAPAVTQPSVHELNAAAIAACALPTPGFMHEPAAPYKAPNSQRSSGVRQAPYITLAPPASLDSESGIAGYFWRLDRGEPTSMTPGDDWHAIEFQRAGSSIPKNIRIEGDALDFEHEFTISAVAVNGAGLQSAPVVHRFRIADPTAPTATQFCVTQPSAPGQLQLAFSSAARDPESGIRGYQYRVRRDNGIVVRDWADPLDAVDFNSVAAGQSVTTASTALANGESYYVDVRAINGRGAQQYVTSGPIRVDYSPPPTPSATVVRVIDYTPPAPADTGRAKGGIVSGFGDRLVAIKPVVLEVQIVAPDDPETGLQVIQWDVVRPFDPGQLQLSGGGQGGLQSGGGTGGGGSSTPIPHGVVPGARTGTYTLTLTSDAMRQLNSAEPGTRYELRLRTINRAGVPSAVHRASFTLPGETSEEAKRREAEQKDGEKEKPRGRGQ